MALEMQTQDYLLIALLLTGLIFLTYKYIEYLKARSTTPGYTQRKVAGFLFLGFITLVGISNVFAEALFEMLELSKPKHFEAYAFGTYVVMAIALVLLTRRTGEVESNSPQVGGTVVNNFSTVKEQTININK